MVNHGKHTTKTKNRMRTYIFVSMCCTPPYPENRIESADVFFNLQMVPVLLYSLALQLRANGKKTKWEQNRCMTYIE